MESKVFVCINQDVVVLPTRRPPFPVTGGWKSWFMSFLLLVVRPGVPSSFLLLVAMLGAPSSVLAPRSF